MNKLEAIMIDEQSTSAPSSGGLARYHGLAMALHWGIAALLIYQVTMGFAMGGIESPSSRFATYQWHKSIGIAILVLSLARLGLRMVKPRPAAVGTPTERLAAKAVHGLFYVIMIGAPLSGWVIVSTSRLKLPTSLFGAVSWPHLSAGPDAHDPAEFVHMLLGLALPALVLLHVGAVIHHLRAHDAIAVRMLPPCVNHVLGTGASVLLLIISALLGLYGPIPNLWDQRSPVSAPSPQAKVALIDGDRPNASAAPVVAADKTSPSENAEPAAEANEPARVGGELSNWQVLPASRLGFTADFAGSAVEGRFAKWAASIRFGENDLPRSSIEATIDLTSVVSDDASRDETLRGPDFFNVALHPTASFAATGFKRLGDGRYRTDGNLTLNGISRPVRLQFTLKVANDRADAVGSATLNRLAFDIGKDEWKSTDQIGDPVSVTFNITSQKVR